MKRLFDLAFSSIGLIVFGPIMLLLVVLIKLKIGTPIFFKQQRPGRHGKPFILYKFRTMTNARNEMGELLPDYLRLTTFGKFLRKLSLDELPQLYNVLKGDMSFVGPRPLLMDYLPLYTKEQAKRHLVKPGITGWAQVNGRNALTWDEKFKLDVWYVKNHTLLLDLKILLLTVKKVVKSDGINNAGHATMPVFEGSKELHEGK